MDRCSSLTGFAPVLKKTHRRDAENAEGKTILFFAERAKNKTLASESTTTRKAGGLNFLASGSCRWQEKTEALLCFDVELAPGA
jgi:hypothetical protein